MNVIAEADKPLWWRVSLFLFTLAATGLVTVFTIARSKRLADFLDALSDDRLTWREKWLVLAGKIRRGDYSCMCA